MSQRSALRGPKARTTLMAAALAAALTLTIWSSIGGPQARAESPPADAIEEALPLVTVAQAQQRPVAPQLTYIARIEAAERVALRPRVAGHIEAVHFREGQLVRRGQALFTIDARAMDAAVAGARAQLQLAQARAVRTEAEASRAAELLALEAISQEEAQRRQAARAESQAQVEAAQAALRSTQLEREFATVRAPIDGRIGRALVTAGNYVGVGPSQTPLAVLISSDAPHLHFDVADPAVLKHIAKSRTTPRWTVELLDEQTQQPVAKAAIDFSDHEIDPSTGTLRLRARPLGDAQHGLPGGFVRVRLAHPEATNSILVPDAAIGTDQGRHHVLVVDAQGTTTYRAVQIGERHGDQRVVLSGLSAGERVLSSGLMRIRPGMKVRTNESNAASH